LWILEELNVPYEIEIFHRDKATKFAPPELKKVHALGKSPIITITQPGGKTITLAESAFITEYLLDHWGKTSTLLPKRYKADQEGKVGGETEEWYACCSLFGQRIVFECIFFRAVLIVFAGSASDISCITLKEATCLT
jgi:glutathione S-transferase